MTEKRLKKLSKKTGSKGTAGSEQSTADVIKDSASQIWLAGLGAFSKAQEEGGKIFEALVKEGAQLQSKTRDVASAKINEVRGTVEGTVGQVQSRASESWDKLEKIFEDRVGRALNSLGVPTAQDIKELTQRVEELQKAVDGLGGKSTTKAKPAAKKKAASKKKVAKKTAKKTATKAD